MYYLLKLIFLIFELMDVKRKHYVIMDVYSWCRGDNGERGEDRVMSAYVSSRGQRQRAGIWKTIKSYNKWKSFRRTLQIELCSKSTVEWNWRYKLGTKKAGLIKCNRGTESNLVRKAGSDQIKGFLEALLRDLDFTFCIRFMSQNDHSESDCENISEKICFIFSLWLL